MSASLSHHFYTMACNNAWANHRLLDGLRQAVASRFRGDARRASSRRSRRRSTTSSPSTGITSTRSSARSRDASREPRAGALLRSRGAVRHLRGAAGRAARGRPPSDRGVRRAHRCASSTRPCRSSAAIGSSTRAPTRLLAHLFQHQIHHRGQAHAMLAGTPVNAAAARRILLRQRGASARRRAGRDRLAEEMIWGRERS